MGFKNLPAQGFPRQPKDNRPQSKNSPNKASLKTPYSNLSPLGLTVVPSIFWGAPVLKDDKGNKYCPGYIGDTFSKNQWDYVQIDYLDTIGAESDKTPGICNVSVRRGRKLDRKKSSGSDGERLTFTGINNADIEISILIWTPAQLDALVKMWSLIQPAVGKGTPGAFDIHHPQFTVNNVKSCVFVDSIGLEMGPTPKTRTFVIRAVEYFPPGTKKITSTPSRAKAKGSTLDEKEENQQPGKNPHAVGPRE